MSKYDNHNTSHLPLIESVIIIAIFAVVSVFIMQLYVAADRLQGKSVNVSKATILAENTVEKIKSGEMVLPDFLKSDAAVFKSGIIIYDKDWNVLSIDESNSPKDINESLTKEAAFYMTYVIDGIRQDESGCYTTFTVTVSDIGVLTGQKGEQLASIQAGMYTPND